MIIGIDFDNTIVCYDELFHQAAVERGLIPATVPVFKEAVRNYLRTQGKEEDWIELQGYVYGARMQEGVPFLGTLEFFKECKKRGIPVYIISHRTRHPFQGPPYDLHKAAHEWLEKYGFYDPARIGLSRDRVYLELTKKEKLDRIIHVGCSHFIDDLPEFLEEPDFPSNVEKVLFDPMGDHATAHNFHRLASWVEIEEFIINSSDSLSLLNPEGRGEGEEKFRKAVAGLLSKAGMEDPFSLHPLPGAANNRVFRVDLGEFQVLLKAYFHHEDDPRDRLGAEFSFCNFAWENSIDCLPRPLACDPKNHLGLYEFIKGRRIGPSEVTEERVREALAFYQQLNRNKESSVSRSLPNASESCFSITAHLECVDRRIQGLKNAGPFSRSDDGFMDLVQKDLPQTWSRILDSVHRGVRELGLDPHQEAAKTDRCLSPSDFGFHNALLTEEGRLRFIDFEYAGWDDPAKMVCDFFCQPAVPVPMSCYEAFAEGVFSGFSNPEMHRKRTALLMPVYRVKWCCILLNEFLPVGKARRSFAWGNQSNVEIREKDQLDKARDFLRI